MINIIIVSGKCCTEHTVSAVISFYTFIWSKAMTTNNHVHLVC